MNITKTIDSLKANGYIVSYFETGAEAVEYLKDTVKGKKIGFGGSMTLTALQLEKHLSESNTVLNPDFPKEGETFRTTAMKSLNADCYFLSANGLSEDGIIVNLDATGNRVAGSLFGHKKVYFVVGTNKIEETLEKTIWRVRNIAAPKNAVRFNLRTPCAVKGDKCYDCKNSDRLCNSLVISLKKSDACEAEVVLINENLGF